jgi:hypothetical protein
VENEETISDILKGVEDTQKDLLTRITSDANQYVSSTEGKKRIDRLLRWAPSFSNDIMRHIFQ